MFAVMPACDLQLVKYGVISLGDALRDLWHWDALYLAGRLHKPTRLIMQSDCDCLDDAMLSNRTAAATAAMLMMPPAFVEEELLGTIVGLSYTGSLHLPSIPLECAALTGYVPLTCNTVAAFLPLWLWPAVHACQRCIGARPWMRRHTAPHHPIVNHALVARRAISIAACM